jgi:dual specificity phosphatase 12
MGKSRSATCVIAYLMQKHNISAAEGLSCVRQARSICEPNDGFMKQLELYGQMTMPDNLEETPAYQRWVYQREVELSRACGQAPEPGKIRFEDEHHTATAADFELRCRKCRYVAIRRVCSGARRVAPFLAIAFTWSLTASLPGHRRPLAMSQYLLSHSKASIDDQGGGSPPMRSSPPCSHYFLDPLSWMRPELEQGKLEGRLECPKCHTNVGKYAWQGMQCSCNQWIVPGFSIAKSRVDESRKATADIRRPPGLVAPSVPGAEPSRQNL